MRHSFVFALAAFGAVAAFGSACANPRTEANVAAALNDAASEIGGLKSDLANIQAELDSLRTVIAKQDTTITRIAEVNHIPVTR